MAKAAIHRPCLHGARAFYSSLVSHPAAVEMAKTAIKLFKEQRLPPTTFIPAEVRC